MKVRFQPPTKTKPSKFWIRLAGKWTKDKLRIKLKPNLLPQIKMNIINLPTVVSWPAEWVITTINTNITITHPSLLKNKKDLKKNLKDSMYWQIFFLVKKKRRENWREEDLLLIKNWILNLVMMWIKKLNKLKKERKKLLMMLKIKKKKNNKMMTELLVKIYLISNLEKLVLTSRSRKKKKRSWKIHLHKKQVA